MPEMLADMGSKLFVEDVSQKCIKLQNVWLECMCLSVHHCTAMWMIHELQNKLVLKALKYVCIFSFFNTSHVGSNESSHFNQQLSELLELAQVLVKFCIKLKSRHKLLLSEILVVLSLQSQQCHTG